MDKTQILKNSEVHIEINGDTNIFAEEYVPKKRGIYGCFHMLYINIHNVAGYKNRTNIYVEFSTH